MFWAVHLEPSGAQLTITLQTHTHLSQPRALANTTHNSLFIYSHKKQKNLSLFPPSLRPTRMEPLFVWQQGTWANAPAGDVPAPRPFFLSVFLPACLPWSSPCLSSAAGPARRGQIQSDLAMVCLGWLSNGPSMGSLLVLASQLSTRR